ncbi:MAG TPA: GlsB/YeaQ/YmgE family stress response membrane protein [Actinomycetota bacterium]
MLGAIILGLVAGAVARLLLPGDAFRHMSGPMSWLVSIAIGLIGAVVGWLLFAKLIGWGDGDIFDLEGIVGAIIGTLIVLPFAGWILRRSSERSEHRRRRDPNS